MLFHSDSVLLFFLLVLNVANDGGVAIKMDFAFQLLTLTVIIISYYN